MLYLTPAAIGYLTQLILAALIGGYLLGLARRPRSPLHTRLLAGFFIVLSAFIALLFLEAAWLPTPRLYAVLAQTPLLSIAWYCLLQFAYHFPDLPPIWRKEARASLGVGGLYALCEIGYAIWRLARLGVGVVEYRPDWSDYLLLGFLLWPVVIMIRQMARHTSSDLPFWSRGWAVLVRPPTRTGRALRAFTLIFLFVAGLGILNLLRTFYLLSVALANAGIALGVLIALFSFVQAYLNQRSETTSFIVKLVGVMLMTVLAVLGAAGWLISPAYSADYAPHWPAGRALRFTPDAAGGYQIAEIPFAFEPVLGRDLELDDGLKAGCSEPLDWPFPFFGQTYRQVYACNDGVISLGQATRYREYQYHYGAGAPLLMPLLLDLDPTISPGGVWTRQETDRLIITWDRLRAFRQPQAEFTFQAVLYADGRFDFVYAAMPESLIYRPNDDPGASLWAVGALPGSLRGPAPQMATLSDQPVSGGPQGVVQDFVVEFRRHLHRMFASLAGLILAVSALSVVGFPLLFYAGLVRPLNALLQSVEQMEAGQLESRAPVWFDDEIGFLAPTLFAFSQTRLGLRWSVQYHRYALAIGLHHQDFRFAGRVRRRLIYLHLSPRSFSFPRSAWERGNQVSYEADSGSPAPAQPAAGHRLCAAGRHGAARVGLSSPYRHARAGRGMSAWQLACLVSIWAAAAPTRPAQARPLTRHSRAAGRVGRTFDRHDRRLSKREPAEWR